MDNKITLQDLKDKVQKFCEARDWDRRHKAKDLAIGIITEASELLEHFRFRNELEIETFFSDETKRTEICEELCDVLFPLLRFAQIYKIDLSTELSKKMKKNELKYPALRRKSSR